MTGYIYCYTNKINNKKYIGQTTLSKEKRAGVGGNGYKKEKIFWKAIVKYGWDTFEYTTLEIVESESKPDLIANLNEREKYWIAFYHTSITDPDCYGYNISIGGGVNIVSEETIQKISNKVREYYKTHTVWNKGLTKETDERIANYAKKGGGQWKPGHQNSEEVNRKARIASSGANSKVARAIICVETGEQFITMTAAANKYNCKLPTLSKCLHGRIKTAAGFHWEFVSK